jgi:hypothetical protein
MEIISEMLEMNIEWGHSRVRLKSLIGILNLNEAWRREVGSSRVCLKMFAR